MGDNFVMKKVVFFSVLSTLLVVAAVFGSVWYVLQAPWKPRPEGMPTAVPSGAGWTNLLEKDQVPLWKNITDEEDIFEIKEGQLHLWGRSLTKLRYAGYTGRVFGDFELHLEFRLARRTNSGVFLRVTENDPVRRGFEVQVLDDHGRHPNRTGTGSLYDVACPMFNMARPAGEWNSYDITVQEQRVVVQVNGWKVLDTDLAKMTAPIGKFPIAFAELPLEGMIALQDHGGEIWFRNMWIRPL